MRKLRFFGMVLLLLCLCGCSGKQDGIQTCLAFRTELLKSPRVCFAAEVCADYDSELVFFSMDCTCTPSDGVSIRMTAPEALSGICARVDRQNMQLIFDDVQVTLPPVAGETLPPLAAGATLYEDWKCGDILYCERKNGVIQMTSQLMLGDRTLRIDTWLTETTHIPQRAQILSDKCVLLTVELTDFRM